MWTIAYEFVGQGAWRCLSKHFSCNKFTPSVFLPHSYAITLSPSPSLNSLPIPAPPPSRSLQPTLPPPLTTHTTTILVTLYYPQSYFLNPIYLYNQFLSLSSTSFQLTHTNHFYAINNLIEIWTKVRSVAVRQRSWHLLWYPFTSPLSTLSPLSGPAPSPARLGSV